MLQTIEVKIDPGGRIHPQGKFVLFRNPLIFY